MTEMHAHGVSLEARETVKEAASLWWLFLLTGIAWIIVAWLILRWDYSTVTSISYLFGFLAIFGTMSAVLQLGSAPYRPLAAVIGVGLGGTLWWLFLSYLVGHLKTRMTAAALDRVNRWAGVLIAAFGFALLMEALI